MTLAACMDENLSVNKAPSSPWSARIRKKARLHLNLAPNLGKGKGTRAAGHTYGMCTVHH